MFITTKDNLRINVNHIREYSPAHGNSVNVVAIYFMDGRIRYVHDMTMEEIDELIEKTKLLKHI